MSARANSPVVIKRRKIVVADGHHGGAWKVAYADFVTALMAFFMMMWLLSATTEDQRSGLADYFSPDIPISRISGGGNGALGGVDPVSIETLLSRAEAAEAPNDAGTAADEEKMYAELREIEANLAAGLSESGLSDTLGDHVTARITDEGVVVEIFALPGKPLFSEGTDLATPILRDLSAIVGDAFRGTRNDIALRGHVAADALVRRVHTEWELSSARSQSVRRLIEERVTGRRVQRVEGHASRRPIHPDPMDVRNNRLELVLLRSGRN